MESKNNGKLNIEKDSIEIYKDILKAFVIDKSIPIHSYGEIDKYISMLSLYIYNIDPAYKYNLPFLTYQHKNFKGFLNDAIHKCELLENVVKLVNKSTEISEYLERHKEYKSIIFISINDFFISDLQGNIKFHEKFYLKGVERRDSDNMYTFQYEKDGIKRVRVCKYSESKFVEFVEKFLGINNASEGESGNNGNS